MKRTVSVLLAMGFTLAFMTTVFAGEWKKEANGRWWYQNDDGSYMTNGWQNIGGAEYYFDAEGYMLSDTVTPDGCRVGPDGVWIREGGGSGEPVVPQASHSVSNITYGAGSVTDALTISDWSYTPEYWSSTYHVFEITNNSGSTLNISINENAKNYSGQVIGAHSVTQEDIPAGCTVFIKNYFSDVVGIYSYDTTVTAKAEDFYIPVIQNLDVAVTDRNDKAIVTVTNRGDLAAEFVEADVVFFENGEISYLSSKYFNNDDYYLMPGATVSEQINAWDNFYTDVKVHVTGRRSKYSTK